MPTQLAPGSSRATSVRTDSTRDVGGEHEEAHRDQLLCAALGPRRAEPGAGEQPDDDEARERLDQAVRAEADQRDRAGGEPRGDRDRELDDVPGDPDPGEQARAALEGARDAGRAVSVTGWVLTRRG